MEAAGFCTDEFCWNYSYTAAPASRCGWETGVAHLSVSVQTIFPNAALLPFIFAGERTNCFFTAVHFWCKVTYTTRRATLFCLQIHSRIYFKMFLQVLYI